MRLKIEQSGFSPSTRKVWLEGVPLLHLIDLTLEIKSTDFTTATLTIGVDHLELDVETAARLIAAIREFAIQGEASRGPEGQFEDEVVGALEDARRRGRIN